MFKNFLKQLDFFSKINDLLEKKEKKKFFLLMLLSITMALFQALGIASILPFMDMVMDPSVVERNELYLYFYDLFNFSSPELFLFYTGLLVLAIILTGNLISAFTTWFKISFVWQNNHRLSESLLKKYLSLPYTYFLNQNTADLGKNVLSEVQSLTGGFILPFLNIITGTVLTLVIFIMLIYVNPVMTLIAVFVLVALYMLIFLHFSKRLKLRGKERVEENKGRYTAANEALGGIKDVKILRKESYFLEKFTKHSTKFSVLQAWYQVVGKVPKYIMEMVAFGGVIVLVLFLLSSDYSGNEIIPLVGFFAFAGYRLMPALQEIFDSVTSLRFHKAILDKVHEDMMQGVPEKKVLKKNRIFEKPLSLKKEIDIKNITFFYPNSDKPVLEDISLKIKKNNYIAIAGTTGSGKTTLADIVLGLLTPDKGGILVDGVEITEKNIRNWQANLGYVPQQIYLSDDTIAKNIAFGVPDEKIDMNQVRTVAKMANIDFFVENELTHGYDTVIGERGIRLSGGQKQRIGIARALYHDPQILVFDEATSSLDNVTEGAVLQAIESVSKLKTMIIIAHRLTTVKNCDSIYLMEKGKVIAEGSYDALVKKNEQFRNMVKDVK